MAISKVISFLSGTDRRDVNPESLNGVEVGESAGLGRRLRNMSKDGAPVENLMSQLRDIIVGPQTRLNEARFEELLDILEEQKFDADEHFDVVEKHLGEATDNATRMTGLLEGQNQDISALKQHVDDQLQEFRDEQRSILAEMRSGMKLKLEILSDVMEKRMHEIEMGLRGEYLELSNSFTKHIADEDQRWAKERDNSMTTLEQRIAQWRAEVDDDRRSDMENLGNSMMDIGRRLVALQGGPEIAR